MYFCLTPIFNLSVKQLLDPTALMIFCKKFEKCFLHLKQFYIDSSNQVCLLDNSVALAISIHVTIKWQNFTQFIASLRILDGNS